MNLILSYIPSKTYEEQNDYLKKIRTINNHYFNNLDKQYPEKNIGLDKEIDYDLYQNSIEDYIKDEIKNNQIDNFNNNGAFLFFISLISYIYENHPFISENMNYCRLLKNKVLVKNFQTRYKLQNTEKSTNNKFSTTTREKNYSKNIFQDISNKTIDKHLRQKSHIKEKEKDALILPKIDSFHSSKRSFSLHNSKLQTSKIKKEKKLINKIIEEENEIKNFKNNMQSQNNINKNIIGDYLFKNNNNLMKSVQISENVVYKLRGQ